MKAALPAQGKFALTQTPKTFPMMKMILSILLLGTALAWAAKPGRGDSCAAGSPTAKHSERFRD